MSFTGSKMLISTEQLKTWLGYTRVGDVEKWLRRHEVAYFQGKTGPVTTDEAVNRKLVKDGQRDFDFK